PPKAKALLDAAFTHPHACADSNSCFQMKQATSTIYLLFLAMLFSSQVFAFKSSPSIFRHATAGMQRRGHTAMALASTDATPYINFLKGPAAL
ncbi:unnamed protein product, partial [Heterosigma akashiwo]